MTGRPPSGAITAMPQINTPFVDADGLHITRPWYQLLRNLWYRTGAGVTSQVTGFFSDLGVLFLSVGAQTVPVITGEEQPDGSVEQATPLNGAAVRPLTLHTSPFVFAPGFQGALVVFGGQVELSRDSGSTWYLTTLQGGTLAMMANDWARVTWFGPTPPPTTFFPGGVG